LCHSPTMMQWWRRRFPGSPKSEWDERAERLLAAKADRRRRLEGQEDAVRKLEALLFEHDPVGINFEVNTDEYRAEAETITLRRAEAKSVDDVLRIVYEEFVRWFDTVAGPKSRYESIAHELWTDWSGDS
jgi:hypothetical protein